MAKNMVSLLTLLLERTGGGWLFGTGTDIPAKLDLERASVPDLWEVENSESLGGYTHDLGGGGR